MISAALIAMTESSAALDAVWALGLLSAEWSQIGNSFFPGKNGLLAFALQTLCDGVVRTLARGSP